MTFNTILFSSANSKWHTPPELVAEIKAVYPIDLDLCASESNVCERYYNEEQDGLTSPWDGWNMFYNHPYSTEDNKLWATAVNDWATNKRLPHQNLLGLIPNRAGARWYKKMVPTCTCYGTVKGRIPFGSDAYWQWRWDTPEIDGKPNHMYGKHGKKQSATFDSTFVFWGDMYPQLWDFLIKKCEFISVVTKSWDR